MPEVSGPLESFLFHRLGPGEGENPTDKGEAASSTQEDTSRLGAPVLRTHRLGHAARWVKGRRSVSAARLMVHFRFLTSRRTWGLKRKSSV